MNFIVRFIDLFLFLPPHFVSSHTYVSLLATYLFLCYFCSSDAIRGC